LGVLRWAFCDAWDLTDPTHLYPASMSDVTLTPSGPPETVLPEADPMIVAALSAATTHEAVAGVVAGHPISLEAWATLGEATEQEAVSQANAVEAYAYFRIGYHRGLDVLRKSGWKGSGYVRWEHPSNRGFLRCLDGLRRTAALIGEVDEEERCAEFLRMLDPRWDSRTD
jgi:hypothetical protein